MKVTFLALILSFTVFTNYISRIEACTTGLCPIEAEYPEDETDENYN